MAIFEFPKNEPKKVEPIEKPKYKQIKECVLRRESGDYTDECKQVMKKLGVDD